MLPDIQFLLILFILIIIGLLGLAFIAWLFVALFRNLKRQRRFDQNVRNDQSMLPEIKRRYSLFRKLLTLDGLLLGASFLGWIIVGSLLKAQIVNGDAPLYFVLVCTAVYMVCMIANPVLVIASQLTAGSPVIGIGSHQVNAKDGRALLGEYVILAVLNILGLAAFFFFVVLPLIRRGQ